MKIGGKEVKEIIISDKDGGLIVSITDDEIINHDDVEVRLVEQD